LRRYVAKRIALAIPNLFLMSVIIFFILRILPGDPVRTMLAGTAASTEQVEQIRHSLGLDRPIYIQYLDFVGNALRGDLGRSIITKRTVTSEVRAQFPSTLGLAVTGMAIALVIGVCSGVLAAVHQRTWIDSVSMGVALLGISMPSFWLALLLLYLFSFKLGWLPAVGVGGWKHLVLPAFVLGIAEAAIIARLVRASMVEVLRREYIVVARAKGQRECLVLIRHALRNALIPVVTTIGLEFGFLLGGAVVIESVFARPGVGRLTVESILARDFPVVQGTVLFVAALFVVINLVVDISYAWLDPTIRYDD
jgi:peptide/nickel transport system permease protein